MLKIGEAAHKMLGWWKGAEYAKGQSDPFSPEPSTTEAKNDHACHSPGGLPPPQFSEPSSSPSEIRLEPDDILDSNIEKVPSENQTGRPPLPSIPQTGSEDIHESDQYPGSSSGPPEQPPMLPKFHSPEAPQGLSAASWQKVVIAGRKLTDQQGAVSAERSRVRELRTALRYKREEEAEIRISLVKQLNSMFAKNDLLVTERIAKEHDRLQSAMDEYLDLENRYHEEEDQLEQNEYDLTVSMEKFLRLLHNEFRSQYPEGTPTGLPPRTLDDYSENDDNYSTISSAPDLPPSIVAYLSRMGDLRVLQESLADLDMQWVETAEKQEQRRPHNIPLDEESLEFLQTYDSHRASLWEEIGTTQLDVNELRSTCEEQGLLTEHYLPESLNYIHQSHTPVQQQQFKDESQYPGEPNEEKDHIEEQCERGRTETKLADPLKMPAGRDFSPFSEPWPMTRNHPVEFINNWILHQLRHSSVQIARFKSLPQLCELNRAGYHNADISRKALTEWFFDDTIVSTHPSPPSSAAASDDEGSLSDKDIISDNIDHGIDSLLLSHATRRKRATIVGLVSGAPDPSSGTGLLRDRWSRTAHSV